MHYRRFDLGWWDRRVNASQKPRRFLEYLVDGRSLYQRHGTDRISCLGWGASDEEQRAAQRLLVQRPPDVDGRVAIYICPECGDLLCGVISARITREGEAVIWRDFASSHYDVMTGTWHHDVKPFAHWPELQFEAQAYEATIQARPPRG